MSILNTKPPGFSTEGQHVARCIGLIEYGTIWVVDKMQKQVRLTWELGYDRRQYRKDFPATPKQNSRDYAASLYGKSWLKRHLITWLGEQVIVKLDQKFDPLLFVGQPCILTIQHNRNSNTNAWYEEIISVDPCNPERCPEQYNENKILTFDNFDQKVFDSLPDFVKKKIKSSKEWEALAVQQFTDENPFP